MTKDRLRSRRVITGSGLYFWSQRTNSTWEAQSCLFWFNYWQIMRKEGNIMRTEFRINDKGLAE